MNKLIASAGGRKWLSTIFVVSLIATMVFAKVNLETIKLFGMIAGGVVGVYNLAQAYSEAQTNGKTSTITK